MNEEGLNSRVSSRGSSNGLRFSRVSSSPPNPISGVEARERRRLLGGFVKLFGV